MDRPIHKSSYLSTDQMEEIKHQTLLRELEKRKIDILEIDKRKDEMEEIRQQSILRELALEQSKMDMEKRRMAMELEMEVRIISIFY